MANFLRVWFGTLCNSRKSHALDAQERGEDATVHSRGSVLEILPCLWPVRDIGNEQLNDVYSMANFLKDWSGNLFNSHKLQALDISGKGGGVAVDARGTVLKCCSAFYHLGILVMSNLMMFKETDFWKRNEWREKNSCEWSGHFQLC